MKRRRDGGEAGPARERSRLRAAANRGGKDRSDCERGGQAGCVLDRKELLNGSFNNCSDLVQTRRLI